ncbi:MAG: hypothetical protein KTR31_31120 [Myxococcales bacterium]|nr:hypothetical protein [Myxococcales bacterium]
MYEDEVPLAQGETTYQPGRHEAQWLLAALGSWFEDGTLTDLLFSVRGGKEATVYCCRAGERAGGGLVAAKVYRPRKFRELSNDAIYREGRGVLDDEGHGLKGRDRRMRKAIRKGTRRGKSAAQTSWLMHEVSALRTLHGAGADVPEPLAANDRAVLMAFVGDEEGAAPTLDRVRPDPALAERLFEQALRNVEILLECGWAHGDLSPYNLLLWEEQLTMIDLPQVADVLRNPHGPRLFLRDVERICRAASLGRPRADHRAVADALWDRVFDTTEGVPEGSIAMRPSPPRSHR